MKICENCKFWEKKLDPKYPSGPEKMGRCKCHKFFYYDYYAKEFIEENQEDGLCYWDFEDYKADFRTGPKFGCIHFKERTEE